MIEGGNRVEGSVIRAAPHLGREVGRWVGG